MHRVCRRDESGFTLIETLVAVMILIIVVGAVYGAFRAGSQSTVLIEENADLNQTARVLLARINSELCSMYGRTGQQGSNLVGESAETGGRPEGFDKLTFTTVSHDPCGKVSARGDVCTVTYCEEADSDGKPLGLHVTEDYSLGLHPSSTDSEPQPEVRLSDLVAAMHCSYLDPDTQEWVDDWLDKTTLPTAVRVELVMHSQRKDSAPIVIASTTNLPTWIDSRNSTQNATGGTGGSSAGGGGSNAGQP